MRMIRNIIITDAAVKMVSADGVSKIGLGAGDFPNLVNVFQGLCQIMGV